MSLIITKIPWVSERVSNRVGVYPSTHPPGLWIYREGMHCLNKGGEAACDGRPLSYETKTIGTFGGFCQDCLKHV